MIFFGHRFIPSEKFYHVLSHENILKTPPSSTLYIEFAEANIELINYACLNHMPLAIKVVDITEALYASAFGAKYIVVESDIAPSIQKIANEYLLDSKILAFIEDESEIEDMAINGVDGVIFLDTIVKIVS